MGNMKSTNDKLNKNRREGAKKIADLQYLFDNRVTEFRNSMAQVKEEEMYALRGVVTDLHEYMMEQDRYILELEQRLEKERKEGDERLNKLESILLRAMGQKNLAVFEEVAAAKEDSGIEKFIELQQSYRKGKNISWDCGVPPVDIIFNEFDMYCYENNIGPDEMSPWHVGQIGCSIPTTCTKRTGMTVGKLIKVYIKRRSNV